MPTARLVLRDGRACRGEPQPFVSKVRGVALAQLAAGSVLPAHGKVRRTAYREGVACDTTLDGAQAAVAAIEALLESDPAVTSLQEYRRGRPCS